MYFPKQIVWDRDKKIPFQIPEDVWDIDSYPKRHTHFIKADDSNYIIATPKTIEEAVYLLDCGIISPAPTPDTHCWRCNNWLTNCVLSDCTEKDKSKLQLGSKV